MNTTQRRIDQLKNFFLAFTIALLAFPGIIGYDLFLFGMRLGRFQPFKFVFVFWVILQWVCIFLQQRSSKMLWRLKFNIDNQWFVLWVAILILDILLGMALLFEGNPGRGSSILFSLFLGQLAALLTVLDKNFSVRWLLIGVSMTTLLLFLFSLMEIFFPHSFLTVTFLKMVRDSPHVSFQLGSSLSTSALAEFTVRMLPMVLLFANRSWGCLASAFGLTLMGLLTLEKSAFLSLFIIFTITFISGRSLYYWKRILAVVAISFIITILLVSPDKIRGRFFGSGAYGGHTRYSVMSDDAMKERKYLIQLGVETMKKRPWLGIGLDGFAFRSEWNIPPLQDAYRPEGTHTHNLFLEMGVSGGIFSFMIFVFIFFYFSKLCIINKPAHWCAILYLGGQLVSCLTDSRIYVSSLAITLFWFAGIAWKLNSPEATEKIINC